MSIRAKNKHLIYKMAKDNSNFIFVSQCGIQFSFPISRPIAWSWWVHLLQRFPGWNCTNAQFPSEVRKPSYHHNIPFSTVYIFWLKCIFDFPIECLLPNYTGEVKLLKHKVYNIFHWKFQCTLNNFSSEVFEITLFLFVVVSTQSRSFNTKLTFDF